MRILRFSRVKKLSEIGQKDFFGDDTVAKNDMEVIMYKILRYLYECMKAGKTPDLANIMWNCKMFDIPKAY